MTTISVIASKETIYHVKLAKKNTSSNYNAFASVYIKGEKSPLFGTSFRDGTPLDEVRAWANRGIEKINDQNLNLF